MSDKSHLNLTFTFENNGKNLKKKCFEKKDQGKSICAHQLLTEKVKFGNYNIEF
jgi:hypothetical protein